MRKKVLIAFAAVALMSAIPVQAEERGGFMGFISGFCFGPRTAAAYNEGKSLHWREWGQFIPVANIVIAVLNGLDGSKGMTTADFAQQFGAEYY